MTPPIPPYFVIQMPLNTNGEGPAGEHETVRVVYQIWDSCNMTVEEFTSPFDANRRCSELNTKGPTP
jgi:hypothetical protein